MLEALYGAEELKRPCRAPPPRTVLNLISNNFSLEREKCKAKERGKKAQGKLESKGGHRDKHPQLPATKEISKQITHSLTEQIPETK